MAERGPATTILDAAFVHTAVFTEPVWSWPKELAERLPSFDDLFVEDRPSADRVNPVVRMRDTLERTPGPVKLLLTGRKGAGKSWAMKRLGDQLAQRFLVVPVSVTDGAGNTLPDADVQDLLLLLAAALVEKLGSVQLDKEAGKRLRRWVELLKRADVPDPPERVEGFDLEVTAWVVKTAARMRSDAGIRRSLRSIPAEDMAEVVRALLTVLAARGKPVVVLFDDVDKLDLDSARRVLTSQSTALSTLNCRMVLTFPFSLSFDGIARQVVGMQTAEVLKNVKVRSAPGEAVSDAAMAYFRSLLQPVLSTDLVEEGALRRAVDLSAGIPREFGVLIQRASRQAYYGGAARIDLAAIVAAERELRIEMQRATQTTAVRNSLSHIRKDHRLSSEEDRRLLDLNLVVEYENGDVTYDVHPILAPVVDEWMTRAP